SETLKTSKPPSTFIVVDSAYTHDNPGWTVYSAVRSEFPILRPRLPVSQFLGLQAGENSQLRRATFMFMWDSESSRLKPNVANGPATTGEQKTPE
ncbi:MAG: hypothetical protein ABL888_20535, partial [Pirellulaceae bacterium]